MYYIENLAELMHIQADYKVIYFGGDSMMLGGRRLAESAIIATNHNHRVSPDLLRWHLRMCLLENMKGNKLGSPG